MADSNNTFELIVAGLDTFGAKVTAITPDRWLRATPCTDWSVRDVVNHVTSEHLWVPHLLRGETIAQVGSRYDGDVLGDDPVYAWERASALS
ncbi:MAG TPA: maleylpyruvate isomerase N-terminal domain-containing protein, partial [Acidothermaceae bacterium]